MRCSLEEANIVIDAVLASGYTWVQGRREMPDFGNASQLFLYFNSQPYSSDNNLYLSYGVNERYYKDSYLERVELVARNYQENE